MGRHKLTNGNLQNGNYSNRKSERKTSFIQSKDPGQEILSSNIWHEQMNEGKTSAADRLRGDAVQSSDSGAGTGNSQHGGSAKTDFDNSAKTSSSRSEKAEACGADSKCWNHELPLNADVLYATPSNDSHQTMSRIQHDAGTQSAADAILNIPPLSRQQERAIDDWTRRNNEVAKLPWGAEHTRRQIELWKETLPGAIHMKGEGFKLPQMTDQQ